MLSDFNSKMKNIYFKIIILNIIIKQFNSAFYVTSDISDFKSNQITSIWITRVCWYILLIKCAHVIDPKISLNTDINW